MVTEESGGRFWIAAASAGVDVKAPAKMPAARSTGTCTSLAPAAAVNAPTTVRKIASLARLDPSRMKARKNPGPAPRPTQ